MCLAIPGRIVQVTADVMRMGSVDFDGAALDVCLAYVPDAQVGDYVLVHAGFALARLDEAQAAETLAAIREIDDLQGS